MLHIIPLISQTMQTKCHDFVLFHPNSFDLRLIMRVYIQVKIPPLSCIRFIVSLIVPYLFFSLLIHVCCT
jgi:hypothetical protein